jgi:2-dehydropantoate 2-reductase
MRMLVVGAGSIGGLFGGRLAQAGRDVTFLVRPSRAEQLRREGLRIVSPLGDATVVPKLLVSKDIHDAFDVVFLSVKAYSLESAIGDFAPAVSDQTMILPILNGMKHMDTLAARFGARAVIGGACKAATKLDKQGRIVQLTKLQDLAYGRWMALALNAQADFTSSCRVRDLTRGSLSQLRSRCGRNGPCSRRWAVLPV